MPTALVVEDTHWLDDASQLVLAKLAQPAPRPWLIVATRRPSGTPLGSEATMLELEPLTADDARTLALAAAGETALSESELAALTERAAGNAALHPRARRLADRGRRPARDDRVPAHQPHRHAAPVRPRSCCATHRSSARRSISTSSPRPSARMRPNPSNGSASRTSSSGRGRCGSASATTSCARRRTRASRSRDAARSTRAWARRSRAARPARLRRQAFSRCTSRRPPSGRRRGGMRCAAAMTRVEVRERRRRHVLRACADGGGLSRAAGGGDRARAGGARRRP